jgi:hypothetical protein
MIFNDKYSQDDFLLFLQDFLPADFLEKEENIIINKDRYKKITNASVLGYCESLDLYVLEMDHTCEKDPRVAIATDAFKILADHWIHTALVVFKNDESDNYRLSYLTISLDLNEKNKAVKKYSNARRYSFYLGSNAKVKTPEQQLIKKGRVQSIDDLFSRFSVEVVNKQFYLEVAKFFDELVTNEGKNLILPSVAQEDINTRKSFAVRLIGRIMFCWFLKQKKSDNGQLIPDELLSSVVVSDNYYHNTLEPLFFGVLNTSINSRDIRSDLFDKVPYLNGGLFNPQTDDFYELDRGIFVSKHINTLKISDSWFKRFFELLETYNFTIDENTVFDQELSVDPEMLGRIFENLLAEINPETGSSERKRTGSFYTPRQIVEYMVDQSLIEYLKTKTKIADKKISALISYDLIDDTEYTLNDKEKLEIINAIESLKILDPACGSGAYPIGALQKIVYILQQIDPDCKMWLEQKLKGVPELYKQKIINEVKSNPFDYTRKLDVIKNSIFGVDIQPIAVDVSRLRCFLTLVVESEIDDIKSNRGIEPLPNLDFKFVCANTLIGLPKTASTGLFDDHSGIIELSKIMSDYFTCNSQRKNEIKLKFTNLQKEIFGKNISAFGKNTGELTLKLTSWNPFDNTSSSWFDPEWMFGLEDKFDVVIGNPPYGAELNEESIAIVKKIYTHKTQETAILFIEKGHSLLKDNGVLTYIIPKAFTFASNYKNLRIETRSQLYEIVDCGKAFENVKLEQVIIILSNSVVKDYYASSIFNGHDIERISLINKELLRVFGIFLNGLRDVDIKIGLKVVNATVFLDKISTNQRGDSLQKHLSDVGDVEVIGGKEIDKFHIRGVKGFVSCAIISEKSKIKDNSLLVQNMIAHITHPHNHIRIIACIPQNNNYMITDTINQINLIDNKYSREYIWCLLNSKFINWFAYNFILGRAIRTMHFDNAVTSRIPMKELSNETSLIIKSLETAAEKIFLKKKYNSDADTKELETDIDELVMDLYGLNEEEKEIIRNS